MGNLFRYYFFSIYSISILKIFFGVQNFIIATEADILNGITWKKKQNKKLGPIKPCPAMRVCILF